MTDKQQQQMDALKEAIKMQAEVISDIGERIDETNEKLDGYRAEYKRAQEKKMELQDKLIKLIDESGVFE